MIPTYEPKHMPRLNDYNGDLSKRWYIEYWLWNASKETLEKKRYWGMNKYTSISARRKVSTQKLEEIRKFMNELHKAAHKEPEPEHRFDLRKFTLAQALTYFMNYKNAATLGNEEIRFEENYNEGIARISKNTFRSYKDLMNRVLEWLQGRKKPGLLLNEFSPKLCNDFFRWLKEVRRIENKTFNKYRGYFSTVFNFYIDVEELPIKNPVNKVEHLRNEESDMHMPFTNEQMQQIKERILEKEDDQLYLFISFIYYAFTRPGEEVRLLRVEDVREKTIFIPSKQAKNNYGEHVAIPRGLEKLIQEYRIRENPGHLYVFSKSGKPGPEPVGKSFFYARHRKILQELELVGYTMYGYKHTGAINLYLETKDILAVKNHCRHHSSTETDKYLRKYGVLLNEKALLLREF